MWLKRNKKIWMAIAICFAPVYSACTWSRETSFFSNFSVRQLVVRSPAAAGLSCDSGTVGGGGGGIGIKAFGSSGTQFNSHKSDGFACRLKSNEGFDEARLFAALKLEVERMLHDSGAQITDSGNPKSNSFYFAYTLKNVRGRVQISGTRIGTDYYSVNAVLEEKGD